MNDPVRRYWVVRLLIVAVVFIGLPTILSIPAFLAEAPIRAGEISPRTVVSPSLLRVEDPEATDRARQEAAESVDPIVEFDPDAQTAVISQVRDYFAVAEEVRQAPEPAEDDEEEAEEAEPPTTEEQVEAMEGRLAMLDEAGLHLLADMADSRLEQVRSETLDIARDLARQRIREGDLESSVDEHLRTELALRDISEEEMDLLVGPFIRSAMRPTVVTDEIATARARRDAAANVSEIQRSYPRGTVIVSAGEEVSAVQVAALERAGLAGADPRWEILRGLAIVALAFVVVGGYLRTYQPRVWGSNRDALLLVVLAFAYTFLLAAVAATVAQPQIWLIAVPAGALAMLSTILFSAPIGVVMAIPAAVLTAHVAPDAAGAITFAAAATLLSVPLVSRLSARGELRRATLHATIGYVVLAGVTTAVFADLEQVPIALLAGTVHGLGAAVIVLGGLPFIETAFGIVTATSLIDLADRNHPLLRELEQKAIGSYNHSVTVATLVERACRAIDADPLLGSVCALYHDIGKVRRPYFFVENQIGIENPHDELEPRVSARVIHRHVDDGMEMATEYNLPSEVVDGIATHHGTTLVTYFYLQAVREAPPEVEVREEDYRYKGRKPQTKETAVLMLADCCEAASRASAQSNRMLTRDQLVELVGALIADRVDDGQLDQSPLTFNDLAVVKESFIETLVGVYHPRISYPDAKRSDDRDGQGGDRGGDQRRDQDRDGGRPVGDVEPASRSSSSSSPTLREVREQVTARG